MDLPAPIVFLIPPLVRCQHSLKAARGVHVLGQSHCLGAIFYPVYSLQLCIGHTK